MASEKRLIDANRLVAELRKSAEYHEKRRLGYFSAIEHIYEQPTVDAVEVVRCKDCKHWDVNPDTYGDAFGPKGCCFGICDGANTTGQNDFCSQGERIDRNG